MAKQPRTKQLDTKKSVAKTGASVTAIEIRRRIDHAIATLDTKALDQLLAELYRPARTQQGAFVAAIELKPAVKVALESDTSETTLEGDVAINWANAISRAKRRVAYDLKVRSGFHGLRIVSEGDSWFQYPLLLRDIIDVLSDDPDKAILSLDAAGDIVADMASVAEYVDALDEVRPDAFLLSGGGNDLLGNGAFADVLRPFTRGATANELIDADRLAVRVGSILRNYRQIVADVSANMPDLPIFGHGYDYAVPQAGGKWLGSALAANRIPLALGADIVRLIVDEFNMRLAAMSGEFPRYRHVDLRGVVQDASGWHDELHPKDPGYGRAADRFRAALADVSASDRNEAAFDTKSARHVQTSCCDMGFGRVREQDALEQEADFEAAAVKPTVDRFIATTHKSSRNGAAIDHIVVHYTTSRSIAGTIEWFKNGTGQSSAHYIIGRDGELVQMVEDTDKAWHAGPMNARSIGIEHVAADGDAITDAQEKVAAALIDWLMHEYGVPKANVIPHRCVKETSCCGDLFKAFGGKAGASCGVQQAALHAWMDSMAIPSGGMAEEADVVSPARRRQEETDEFVLANDAGFNTHRRGGSGRLLLAQSLTRDARRVSGDSVNDVHEFSNTPIGNGVDWPTGGASEEAALRLIDRHLPDFEADSFDAVAFADFIRSLGLRHFTPVEFLYLGASNQSGPCAGRNTLPPQSLWRNIANTARMLDEVRARLGAPIRILSVYRSQAYNACISGAGGSQHKTFNAIDWRSETGDPSHWRDVARAVRASDPRFTGGIGTYGSFVHIDTRGNVANWTG